jgi:aryl-alcohol dehydrogenase-like predicted oxidoreductase
MNTRQLGTNGPKLTVIGSGSWAISGPWLYGWGAVDDRESVNAIHRELERGITWIDTVAAFQSPRSHAIWQ